MTVKGGDKNDTDEVESVSVSEAETVKYEVILDCKFQGEHLLKGQSIYLTKNQYEVFGNLGVVK